MAEQPKRFTSRRTFTFVLLALVIGLWVGYAVCRWENGVAQKAAAILWEVRYLEAFSEESNQINRYWDVKPEVARALLERELRTRERLLQTIRQFNLHPAVLSEDVLLKDMALMHMRLASLCRRLNQPDCVSEHVNEAMRLRKASSNEVWAAIDKLEQHDRAHRQTPNE